jgi:hypothetical protein
MKFVIIGGGISGVSCALELSNLLPADDEKGQADRDFYLTPQQIKRRQEAEAKAKAAGGKKPEAPKHSIVLITPSPTLKSATAVAQLTKHLEQFEVRVESPFTTFAYS